MVLITIPGSCREHFLGSKLVHHLYYEDDEPFQSFPITISPRQFGGHSYYIKILLRIAHNEGIGKTISIKNQLQFRPCSTETVNRAYRTDALYTLYCYYQSAFTTAWAFNIKNFPQLCFKLKPYIYYLASKISKKQNREYEYTIEIDITVIFNNEPETYDAIILVEDYTLMSYPDDDMIFTDSHANMIFNDKQENKLNSKPFMT